MSIHVHSEFRIEELLNSTSFKSVPDIVFNCLTICIQDLWLLFILNNDLQQWVFIFCLSVNTRSDLVYLSWSFHLLLDPGYRVSPASHTKCSVWAGTWYRWLFSWSFHLLMDPVYRVSPASLTKCSVSAGTWYDGTGDCLARVSTCFWTQGTEYLQQVTQNAQFQLVQVTLCFSGTRGTFTGKNRCMPACQRLWSHQY